MRKWNDVKIVLLNGDKISLTNCYFKMRAESLFCIENENGEGNCIPVDNISNICLNGGITLSETNIDTDSKTPEKRINRSRFVSKLFRRGR